MSDIIDNKSAFVDIKNIMLTCNIQEMAVCEFEYVKEHLLECRAKERLPKDARSIIIAAFPYRVEQTPPKNISRYAAVPDYHTVCGKMLESAVQQLRAAYPENKFEWFIDNSPIPEVAAGVHAGLGRRGENGLLINEKYGSFVFLGEIVTDLEIEPEKGAKNDKKCLDCGQCKAACPINLNKADCLSAVNQKKKGLTTEQIGQIKQSGCVWGCDICGEVCPMNKNTEPTYIEEFVSGYRKEYQPNENSEGRAYNWRGED
ncbi:MAG: epoxyqueuosine reductase, partial [Clostridiales bacterium]|nr:epoxyqueuosine reductase [Candidatus Equinaster intestinalis]